MKFFVGALVLLFLFGCSNQTAPRQTNAQFKLTRFIENCNRADPSWTLQQKSQLRQKVEKRRISVSKEIASDSRMKGATLSITTTPQAINAGCTDALYVSVDGVVLKFGQKRVLEDICRRNSDDAISVYGSQVGVK